MANETIPPNNGFQDPTSSALLNDDKDTLRRSNNSQIIGHRNDNIVQVEVQQVMKIARLLSCKGKDSKIPTIFASLSGSGILTSIIQLGLLYINDGSKEHALLFVIALIFCAIIFFFCLHFITKWKEDNKKTIRDLQETVSEIHNGAIPHFLPTIQNDDTSDMGNNTYSVIDYDYIYKHDPNRKKRWVFHLGKIEIYRNLILLLSIILPFPAFSKTNSAFIKTEESFDFITTISIVLGIIGIIATIISTRIYLLSKKQTQRYKEELTKLMKQNINPEKRNKQLIQEGNTALAEGNINTAITKYSESIMLDLQQPEIYEKRADAYSQIGKTYQSLEDYKRALKLYLGNTSNHIQILHKIANLHYSTGSLIESEIYYKKALDAIEKTNPKKRDSLTNQIVQIINDYASLLIEQNKYTNANSLLSKALDILKPTTGENLDLLAMTLNNSAILYKETYNYTLAEKSYTEALTIYRQLSEKDPDIHLPDVAMSLNNLANLHKNINQYKIAEKEYYEALTTYQQLSAQNPNAYLPYVAQTLNNLANLHKNTNRYKEAESEYYEALSIRRQLAAKSPDAYMPDVAIMLNNIGELHRVTNRYQEAEEELNEALTIRRQLAAQKPDAYLPYVATTLNNLANLHNNTNQLDKAEEEYNEALTIRRQLAAQKPDAHLPYVATTLNNLGILHKNINQLDKAEEEYNEALTTYRQLADKNPDAYLPYVAATLNNIGELHRVTKRYKEAEEEYNEALTIRRQLADKNPDAYLPYVATTLNNLGLLHCDTNQLDKAEEEYNEALTTYRQLADKNPDAYLPYVATTLNNLAVLHKNTKRYNEAEEEYNKALTIRRQLAAQNSDAYLHKVAQTLYNMASLHLDRKEYDPAEAAAQESLEKYRIMAEKSHAAFDSYVKKAEELLERIRKAKEADA